MCDDCTFFSCVIEVCRSARQSLAPFLDREFLFLMFLAFLFYLLFSIG